MQNYIFLDLDDTLFQTLRKCEHGSDDPALAVRAFLPDGTPNSFATRKQQWLWQWFQKDFKIVPVTARDAGAFGRVNLPFREEAVLNHGAVILDRQRRIDKPWMERMQDLLPDYYEKLLEVWEEVQVFAGRSEGYKLRLVRDFGIDWFGVVKHRSALEAPLRALLEEAVKPHPAFRDGCLYAHLNGNNLAILPKLINKEDAVRYLLDRYRRRHPEILTFGAGDSRTDAPFLALCDYALIPKNTQLFQTLVAVQ
ncbi:HAD family hydrolase [Methylomicrobium album]|uniref:Putative HAD superfamily hydrolase n=1 Tax=Methylomicrobium album BG8 TaxID=686340 RepID=H8GG71_METAL|nr:HAD family hydrolase [Methylomicrobium album]EIC29995.1 putative HAD superfamily hydrolase [Methylomicrobium album BG8]